MTEYVTVGGDSLPSIAEAFGHPGEWSALAAFNEGHVWGDFNNLQPGLTIQIPGEWAHEPEIEPPSTQLDYASATAAELITAAQNAQTLAELDAIDAAANGRTTVLAAVDQRRAFLLDQGATQ